MTIQSAEQTQDKPTEDAMLERMLEVANEQATLDADMKELCDRAKDLGYDAALLKKIAVAKAKGKLEELHSKTQELLDKIEEVA
jgi:uncharacterized protein (UPF0335 family)